MFGRNLEIYYMLQRGEGRGGGGRGGGCFNDEEEGGGVRGIGREGGGGAAWFTNPLVPIVLK